MSHAARFIESKTSLRPTVGVVLGSGLGAFADSLLHATRIPYGSIPGFPISTAIGHAGELVVGTLGANGAGTVDVAVMAGRFHLYEGYTPQQVVTGVRALHQFGVKRLVLTNAAGGINLGYAKGALVLLSDHINLQGVNPLTGPNDPALGPRFPDMTEVYSLRLRALAHRCAADLGLTLPEGVYAGLLGPSYETPAEIRYLKAIGADLVGMSTVAEATAAHHAGAEVLGLSCVTNVAAGLSPEKLDQQEVIDVGQRVSGTLFRLLSSLLPKLGELS
jgi:purine-nucleoside phosphorylase